MKTVFCSLMDDNFFPGFKIFFLSLLKHNPDFDYDFYFFDNGLSPPVKKDMVEIYKNIKFYPIEKELYEIPEGSTVDRLAATYYKLEIFNPNFLKGKDRVIFIDMDILIQGSIQGLVNSNLKKKPLGACKQFAINKDELIEEINSGVMVLDPKALKEGVFENLLERVKKGAYLPDQEIINREFLDNGLITYLPKMYNVEKRMMHSKKYAEVYDSTICLHYVNTKPWEEKAKTEKEFYEVYEKWWEYEERSPEEVNALDLSEIPLPFRTLNTVVLREETDLGENVYDCIYIKEDFETSQEYLINIVKNNLSQYGYICGYNAHPFAIGTISGHLVLVMKDKPRLLKNDFYLFLKERRKYEYRYEEMLSEGISDEDFNYYLKGKRVVLVGPASSMIGRGQGEFIDSFDVVIRTNNMINALIGNEIAQKDFGSRTDILYVNVTYERDMLESWRMRDWINKGLKYVCRKMGRRLPEEVFIPWRRISPSPLPPPTAFLGTRAIHDLLQFDLKELYVTGMDAYEGVSDIVDGDNSEYLDNYLPELEINRRNNRMGEERALHDKYRDTEWLLSLEDLRLKLDPFSKEKMEKVVKSKKEKTK